MRVGAWLPSLARGSLFERDDSSDSGWSSVSGLWLDSSTPTLRHALQPQTHRDKLWGLQRLAFCLVVVAAPVARQDQRIHHQPSPTSPPPLLLCPNPSSFYSCYSHSHDQQDQHAQPPSAAGTYSFLTQPLNRQQWHPRRPSHGSFFAAASPSQDDLPADDDTTATSTTSTLQSPTMPPPRPSATLQEAGVLIPSTDGVQIACKVSNKHSPFAVVISHPYGPLGGNLGNNVVWALTQHLSRFGFTTLRFNFRGVLPSTGRTSWTGAGEKADMKAVCEYALTQLDNPPQKLLIIGYSHGSVVGSALGGEMPEVHAYAAIAYPFSVAFALTLFRQRGFFLSAGQGEKKPKLFVMGSQDQFTGLGVFRRKVKELPSPMEVVTMEGVDHFFFGKEGALCAVVQGWVEKVLGTQDLKAFLNSAAAAVAAAAAAVAGKGVDDGGSGRKKALEERLPVVCEDGHQEL